MKTLTEHEIRFLKHCKQTLDPLVGGSNYSAEIFILYNISYC